MRILRGSLLALCLIAATMANPTQTSQSALAAVSQGINQFSSSFFQTVTGEQQGNLITSPLSAALCLSMAAYGARGTTEKQFRDVLHIPSDDSLGTRGYQTLIDTLNNVAKDTSDVDLRITNKIYVGKSFPVKPSYKELTETYFRSASESVNFAAPVEAANTINTWVQQQTNNRIHDIVQASDLDPLTAMVLVNAVYFKGQWKRKFDPANTKDLPFHVNANTQKNVPTMFKTGNFRYGELPEMNAKFVELPYKGDELSMVIVLPNEIDGLAEVERKLENVNIVELLNQGFERELNLYLPKFKIENTIDLKAILEKMGLPEMFTEHANFTGIADANLSVSKAVQKAFIEVNEEGSEAAAVTGLEIMPLSLIHEVDFTIKRPFFYSIVKATREPINTNKTLRTGRGRVVSALPLFYGRVVEPQI